MKHAQLSGFFGIIAILMLSTFAFAQKGGDKAVEWSLDTAHTTVGFSVRHLGITKVKGTFKDFSGEIKAEPTSGKLAWVKGVVKIDSVDTGIEKRDAHLKADDFFDAKVYPTMTLEAGEFVWKSGTTFTAKGKLTIKGVTKDVTLEGEYLGAQRVDFGQGPTLRAGYSLKTKINRKDFGLGFNAIVEGVSVVSDEVTIHLDAQIFRAADTAK